jgi:hypothetical protein
MWIENCNYIFFSVSIKAKIPNLVKQELVTKHITEVETDMPKLDKISSESGSRIKISDKEEDSQQPYDSDDDDLILSQVGFVYIILTLR